MPYINIKQVAEHLGVSEKTVYRLIDKDDIPAVKVGNQWRFNRLELEDWLKRGKPKAGVVKHFDEFLSNIESRLLIYNLLKNDGIFFKIPGKTKEEVLENAIEVVKLEPGVDRKELLADIISREKLCSTGIGHGISIPHSKFPHSFHFSHSSVALCFLKNKVDFDAIDHLPVDKLFLIFARTIKEHLHILKVLGRLFNEKDLHKLLEAPRNQRKILGNIKQLEENLKLKVLSANGF